MKKFKVIVKRTVITETETHVEIEEYSKIEDALTKRILGLKAEAIIKKLILSGEYTGKIISKPRVFDSVSSCEI